MSFTIGDLGWHGPPLCPVTAKAIYPTKDEARKALRRLNEQGYSGLHVYRCAWCEKYHFGGRRGHRD